MKVIGGKHWARHVKSVHPAVRVEPHAQDPIIVVSGRAKSELRKNNSEETPVYIIEEQQLPQKRPSGEQQVEPAL